MITLDEMKRRFLNEHRHADLIYDENTKELICAVYLNPKYSYKKDAQLLLGKLRKIIEKQDNDNLK